MRCGQVRRTSHRFSGECELEIDSEELLLFSLGLCNRLCDIPCVATNIELNKTLIEEAQRLGHHRSKRAIIEEALREYVQHRMEMEIINAFGQIDYNKSCDHKALRKRR